MKIVTLCLAILGVSVQAAFADWVYVSNEKDHSISVIDSDTNAIFKTLAVGLRPRALILSKDFKHLIVAASDSNTVQIIDLASDRVVADLTAGDDPEQFALHPNNAWLYVANEDDALSTVIDIKTGQIVAEIDVGVEPEGVAVSHDGSLAVVTSETTNMAHWIDTKTQTLVHNTLVDARPRAAEFNSDDSELWVSSEIGGSVSVIDVPSRDIVHRITFAIPGVAADRIQPVGIALTSDGKYAFVALGPANHVAIVDRATMNPIAYVQVGRRVWHLAFSDNETRLYATNGVSGDVTVIDVIRQRAIVSIKVGSFPWGVAVLPAAYLPK